MVSMAMIFAFTFDVTFKVFSDVLREVVFILELISDKKKCSTMNVLQLYISNYKGYGPHNTREKKKV